MSDIQDYFNYTMKKIKKLIIYQKRSSSTELSTKFLGSKAEKITKGKKYVPHLEITEVILVHCNRANNEYQPNSRVHIQLFEIL